MDVAKSSEPVVDQQDRLCTWPALDLMQALTGRRKCSTSRCIGMLFFLNSCYLCERQSLQNLCLVFVTKAHDLKHLAPEDLSTFLVGSWWQQLSTAPITFDLVPGPAACQGDRSYSTSMKGVKNNPKDALNQPFVSAEELRERLAAIPNSDGAASSHPKNGGRCEPLL